MISRIPRKMTCYNWSVDNKIALDFYYKHGYFSEKMRCQGYKRLRKTFYRNGMWHHTFVCKLCGNSSTYCNKYRTIEKY